MQPLEALKLLDTKMEEFGLTQLGWKSDSMRAKEIVGRCNYTVKTIELSWPLTLVNSAELITDTILHEIAHALVGPGHHHNLIWQHKAVQIGARPIRCSVGAVGVERQYKMKCLCPNKFISFHRKPRLDRRCPNCKYLFVHVDEPLISYQDHIVRKLEAAGMRNVRY